MSAKSFLDSNVVVYAYDKDEPAKQTRAQAILKGGVLDENAMVSVQVLGEFFNVVTRRIRQPMTADEARNAIGRQVAQRLDSVRKQDPAAADYLEAHWR